MENENKVQAKDVEIDLEKNGKDIVGGQTTFEKKGDYTYCFVDDIVAGKDLPGMTGEYEYPIAEVDTIDAAVAASDDDMRSGKQSNNGIF